MVCILKIYWNNAVLQHRQFIRRYRLLFCLSR